MSIFGIAITLFLALLGELYRFHGFLLLDIWVPLFIGAWLLHKIHKKTLFPLPKIVWPAAAFTAIGLASLLLNSGQMGTGEFLSSAAFGLRWFSLFMLMILALKENPATKKKIFYLVLTFGVLLSIAGFVQLKIQPDFTEFELLGWDPHQGRLLSTWFDPNFVGGFLAFLSTLTLGEILNAKPKEKLVLGAALLIILAALLLTFSRSAYLALATGLFIFGLLRSWKLLGLMAIASLLLITLVQPVQTRVLSLVDGVRAALTETYSLPDASARLRYDSWREGWQLFVQKPILGHGYNRYAEASLEAGTLNRLEDHSASGSDASLLTILATTGLLGFIPFLLVYLLILRQSLINKRHGLIAALCGLFVHSLFVSSLLFPLLMAPVWILLGLKQGTIGVNGKLDHGGSGHT